MLQHGSMRERTALPVSLYLVEEINHRVAREYGEAIATLTLAASRSSNSDLQRLLANAARRLREHAAAHRALEPPDRNASASLADYLGGICQALSQAILAERGIRLVLDIENVELPPELCWRVGLVVAELIRNAALRGRDDAAGQITICLALCSRLLTCLICDTGLPPITMPQKQSQKLVRDVAADFGGSVEWAFTSTGGCALLQFPMPSAAEFTDARASGQCDGRPSEPSRAG